MKSTPHLLPAPATTGPDRWPQIGGADIELGNSMAGIDPAHSNVASATAILSEFEGISSPAARASAPVSAYSLSNSYDSDAYDADRPAFNPQDWCRKWSTQNGSCTYIDMSHVELALPEISSAREFVKYWHASLRMAGAARDAANARLSRGRHIELLANNSDGHGASSWGAHLNFCIPKRAFERILYERVDHLLFLAGFQASSMIFTGQGKVGSDNRQPHCPFQLSQRADFIESVSGWQTTFRRPIVNLRDEALCGRVSHREGTPRPADKWSRVHVIFHDSALSHISNFLKFGVTQIVLQMIAEGWVETGLLLEDPLGAVQAWSHDITLRATAPLLAGGSITAIGLQLRVLEQARRFIDEGRCQVIDAREILDLWHDTLSKLNAYSADPENPGLLDALAPRLDWARKLTLITHAMRRHFLGWDSAEVKHLDFLWASLDPAQGLYWAMDRAGAVEHIVTEHEIARAMIEPPDTRAWARAALLKLAGVEQVADVNWDSITFNVQTPSGPGTRTLELPDPHLNRACFENLTRGCSTLNKTLDALGAKPAISILEPVSLSGIGGSWPRFQS